MKKIYYDAINQSLNDAETDEVIYRECHDGEIDLTDVVSGNATWEHGNEPYTLVDFCAEVLELGIHGVDFTVVENYGEVTK